MYRDYAVRVSLYYTAKGKSIAIAIGNAEVTKFEDGCYYETEVEDNKMFLVISRNGAKGRVLRNGVILISSLPAVEKIDKFEGEYDVLHYDKDSSRYYIDLNDSHEFTRLLPSRAGIKTNHPSKKAQYPRERQIKIDEPKSSNVEKSGPPKDDVKSVLTSKLLEYAMKEEFEKCKILIEIIEEF